MRKAELLFMVVLLIISTGIWADNESMGFTQKDLKKIEELVKGSITKDKMTGVTIAVVKGRGNLVTETYGYADKKNLINISEKTLFELGSNSKAITALGLQLLIDENKISLKDPVDKYLPWLTLMYQGKEVKVTIEQFINHTSGIPFGSIRRIPADNKSDAIERAVRTLVNTELENKPGASFSYATINYDVVGLVIEKVTGLTFEDYIREAVLLPLGLGNTYTNLSEARKSGVLSKGYKINFLAPREYEAPYYRGQVPAGYMISNIEDMSRWLQIQMGFIEVPKKFERAIEKSHIADPSVGRDVKSLYSAGWNIELEKRKIISHGGNNPNFSSYMAFSKTESVGVVVLGNMNSVSTVTIGKGVLDILTNMEPVPSGSDLYLMVDKISTVLLLLSVVLTLSGIFLIRRTVIMIVERKRSFAKPGIGQIIHSTLALGILLFFAMFLYQIPYRGLNGLDWKFIQIWSSAIFMPAVILFFLTILTFTFNFHLKLLFRAKNR